MHLILKFSEVVKTIGRNKNIFKKKIVSNEIKFFIRITLKKINRRYIKFSQNIYIGISIFYTLYNFKLYVVRFLLSRFVIL